MNYPLTNFLAWLVLRVPLAILFMRSVSTFVTFSFEVMALSLSNLDAISRVFWKSPVLVILSPVSVSKVCRMMRMSLPFTNYSPISGGL